MSNGQRTRVGVAALTVAILMGVSVPAAAAATASPKKWANKFCSTVIGFRDDMAHLSDEIASYASEAEAELTTDPTAVFEVIETMAGYSDSGAELASDTATAIRALPKPKVGGGAKIKRVIAQILGGGLEALTSNFDTASDDFRAITDGTSNPIQAAVEFTTVAGELADTLTTVFDSIDAAFDALPDDPSIDPDGVLERALSKSSACADF